MPQWNFNTPYRLLDVRTACGQQVVVDDAAAAYAAIPAIWNKLQEWKKDVDCDIDDCSLELAGVRFLEGNRYVLRWGLLLRVAAPAHCSAAAVSDAAGELKALLCEHLNKVGIKYSDVEDDKAVLPHFPVFDMGTAEEFWTGSFAKEAERSREGSKLLTWYRELKPVGKEELSGILRVMERNACCGLSLEIHAMPRAVCEKAEGFSVQDEECAQWLKRIGEENVVSARLVYWGDKTFADAVKKAVNKRFPTLEQKRLQYTQELSRYMVFDPWAYMDNLIGKTASKLPLGATKYALTLEEMDSLCSFGDEIPKGTTDPTPVVNPTPVIEPVSPEQPQPEVTQAELKEMNRMLGLVYQGVQEIKGGVKENGQDIRENTARLVENTKAVEIVGDEIRQNTKVLGQIISEISELSGKIDKLPELVKACEKIVPAGCEIAITDDERKWLGIENEEELYTKYELEESAVRLLKTALTLARLGMEMDEDEAALMAFSTPLGAFYEYMMRRYFQPSIYDHSPDGKDFMMKNQEANKQTEVPLSHFDWISEEQIKSYVQHAQIDGKLHNTLYWFTWLNIFRPLRFGRNRVHTGKGEMKKDQLKMMYDLLIKPDDEAKLVALKYAYNHASGGDRLKLKIGEDYFSLRFDELLDRIKKFKEWYEPSLFHFILKCGKAEWV